MLTIFTRAVLLFAAAVTAMRLMGKRQVGQLQPYELVVVIMIAELAATPMGGVATPLLYGLLPMVALVACHGFLSFGCMHSKILRKLLCGEPAVLMRKGVVCEKQLRKSAMTLEDLMEQLRVCGYADPAQVSAAVMETGGVVTVVPKAAERPVTPKDLGLTVDEDGLPLPLVLDGHIYPANLIRGGLTRSWLDDKLNAAGFTRAEDVLLCCVSRQGVMTVQGKGADNVRTLEVLEADKTGW